MPVQFGEGLRGFRAPAWAVAMGLMLGAAPAAAKTGKCLHIDPAKGKGVTLTGKLAAGDADTLILRLSRPICDAAAPDRILAELRVLPTRSATRKHLRNLTGFTTTLSGRLYPEPGVPQPAPPVFVAGRVLVP